MHRFRHVSVVLLVAMMLFGAAMPVSAAVPLEEVRLSDVAFGAGRFVAVGNEGRVFTSVDGREWIPQDIGVEGDIFSIVYQDGLFVASTYDWGTGVNPGMLLTSEDGITWNRTRVYATALDIAGGGGTWVATLTDGRLMWSADGRTWQQATQDDPWQTAFRNGLSALVYDRGGFRGVDMYGRIHRFQDGVVEPVGKMQVPGTDETRPETWVTVQDALQLDGRVYAVAFRPSDVNTYVFREPEDPGQPWDQIAALPGRYFQIRHIGGRLWAYGFGSGIITSEDGVSWTRVKTPHMRIVGLAYGNGAYVAVDRTGVILRSADGATWEAVRTEPDQVLYTPVAAQPSAFKVRLDGLEIPPQTLQVLVADGRSLLPVRRLAELLGAEVVWHESLSVVEIRRGSQAILLPVNSDVATLVLDDSSVALDVPAIIHEGRTYAPVRFVAEALGLRVDFDQAGGTIILTSR